MSEIFTENGLKYNTHEWFTTKNKKKRNKNRKQSNPIGFVIVLYY